MCPQRRVICSACVCAGVWAPAKPLPSVQGRPEADGLHAGPPRGLPGAERGCGGVRGPDGDHVQRAAQQQLPGLGQRGERLAGKQPRGCPKLGAALTALKSLSPRGQAAPGEAALAQQPSAACGRGDNPPLPCLCSWISWSPRCRMIFTKPTWKITVRACVAASLGPAFGELLGVLGRAGSPLGTSGDPWPCVEQALLPAVGSGTSFPMGGDRSLPAWCGAVCWVPCLLPASS